MKILLIALISTIVLYIIFLWIVRKVNKANKPAPFHTDLTFEEYNSKWDKYYGIVADVPVITTLAEIKDNDCQSVIKKMVREGDQLMLLPDPENEHNKTAIRVCTKDGWMVGWLPNKEWSEDIFHDLQKGKRWDAYVDEIIRPRKDFNFYNVLIELWEFEPMYRV